MADNKLISGTKDPSKETIKNQVDITNLSGSLLLLFDDDETDAFHIQPQSKQTLFVDVSNYDFTKPMKRFDMDVSYDSAQDFYRDLGFNKMTIDRLKPYFSSLEQFVDYDVYAVIERLEGDILDNEINMNKLDINNEKDLFQALQLLGFEDEWAQTYTWIMGEAYADQLVKESIKECIHLRLNPLKVTGDFPDWTDTTTNNNQWSSYSTTDDKNIFIRKQEREDLDRFNGDLDQIDFDHLKRLSNLDQGNKQYWFHGTNWDGASGIIHNGAERRGDNTDFSRLGAFYLNNNYWDCYEWLFKRDILFNGMYAILIYEFDPHQLSNGNYISFNEEEETPAYIKLWQQIVFSCLNIRQKEVRDLNGCHCVFGWQCANPNDVRPSRANKDTPKRRLRHYDERYAVQLAIRTNRMLTRVDEHLIGVIIFKARKPSRL